MIKLAKGKQNLKTNIGNIEGMKKVEGSENSSLFLKSNLAHETRLIKLKAETTSLLF